MRILFDAHHVGRRQTGNETYSRELVGALRSVPDVDVVAAVDRHANGDVESLAVPLQRLPADPWRRLVGLALAARTTNAHLLHSMYYLPPFAGVPAVVTIHDVSYERFPEFFGWLELYKNRTLVRSAVRRAAAVVTVSEHARGEMISLYDLEPARVSVVANGVSPVFHMDGCEPRPPLEGRELRVLGVGTVQPRKNLLRLAEAIRRIADETPVCLRLVGPDGFQAAQIRARIARSAEVDVLGYLTEAQLANEYRAADVLAYPSIYEGFGLPVIEAMASGTPVVTSTGGALPEVAGDAALLVDPFDVDALAAAILRIAEDPGLATTLSARGLERAAHFTWSRAADALVGIYRRALGEPTASQAV